jgi:hypothetical protein
MLGSLTAADDAVQDARLRVSRAGAGEVDNLGGWLTTIVARVCLNMLRARNRRREEPFGVHIPDPGAEIPAPDPDLTRQREVVDAFFPAARGGGLDGLVALLHPHVVLRSDLGARRVAASVEIRGAAAVARQARGFPGAVVLPALVNGAAGAVITVRDGHSPSWASKAEGRLELLACNVGVHGPFYRAPG